MSTRHLLGAGSDTIYAVCGASPATDGSNVTSQPHLVSCEECLGSTSRESLIVLLREAEDLLSNARCSMTDPGLARSWGQRKRRFRDSVINLAVLDG